jgi:hypothetical protein
MYRVLADEFEESRWEILLYDSADEVVQLLCHQATNAPSVATGAHKVSSS